MRNCYIARCDLKNKNDPKRAMFNVPVKDPALFEQWKEVIPQHRPLKEFDRICEIHFREEDISRYWEHTINGKVERMERHKAALKPNAIPVHVDVLLDNDLGTDQDIENARKRKRTKKTSPAKKSKQDVEVIDVSEEDLLDESGAVQQASTSQSGIVELSIQKIEHTIDSPPVKHNIIIEMAHMMHPEFETLYDEVYEVELPTTLWGIHRDLEKKFICFSEFSKATMNIQKYLYIDQCLQYRMAVGQRVMKCATLENGSTETITELLRKLEEIKIKKVIVKGSSSLLNES